jgi:transcriptional regulator with XRE-family HTH domain
MGAGRELAGEGAAGVTVRTASGRRRRLGAELRRLREDAGVTIERVAERLECSHSKVSRIENGQVSASPRDVRDMLELYRVDPGKREALVQIARETRRPGWWQQYRDVPGGIPAYAGMEVAATSIDMYMALVVPGLLQTADYASAVIRAVGPDLPVREVERRVELRMRRQTVLQGDKAPRLRVLLDESVLRRPVGGREVMRPQLQKLLAVTELPTVTLQVVPMAAGAHAGIDGSFEVCGFPAAEPDVVVLESAVDALYLDSPDGLRRYSQVFELLRGSASPPGRSKRLIAELLEELYPAT